MSETKAQKPKAEAAPPKPKVVVAIKDILEMLESGKTRDDIGQHYGLNKTQVAILFRRPELKGKKTKKASIPQFVVAEDMNEMSSPQVQEAVVEEKEDQVLEEIPQGQPEDPAIGKEVQKEPVKEDPVAENRDLPDVSEGVW